MRVGDRMSKSTLGQKSLGLTTRLLVGSGMVLSLTQSLDEEGVAGKSLAELRQQTWTQEVFAGNLLEMRGSEQDILDFQPSEQNLRAGSQLARASGADATLDKSGTYVQMAGLETKAPLNVLNGHQVTSLHSLDEEISVNAGAKGDRRIGWQWEPFSIANGRKAIGLNWSGSLWSIEGPFVEASGTSLPKLLFTPSDDLELVMADAKQFLMPEIIPEAPKTMIASNTPAHETSSPEQGVDGVITGSTALAYAPNSVEALEEPFKAILTEQQTGQISEDNQVTILGALEDLKQSDDKAEEPKNLASLPITALPQPRKPFNGKVSEPLDISPVVVKLQEKEEAETEPAKTVVAKKAEEKKIGLTEAKSRAVRAELKLASLSGDKETKEKKKSRFASWFNFGSAKKKAKIVTKGEHAWVSNKLPKSSFTKKQKTCLANAIYFESRSEPVDGQIAVAQVVANRVKNPAYPNTLCGVVYQNKHKRNACQFSFACDRIPDRIRSKKAWDLAWKLSNQVVNGEVWLKSIGSSTHYHATYVNPKWAKTMKRRKKIGLHIFYKTYGGGWS